MNVGVTGIHEVHFLGQIDALTITLTMSVARSDVFNCPQFVKVFSSIFLPAVLVTFALFHLTDYNPFFTA